MQLDAAWLLLVLQAADLISREAMTPTPRRRSTRTELAAENRAAEALIYLSDGKPPHLRVFSATYKLLTAPLVGIFLLGHSTLCGYVQGE